MADADAYLRNVDALPAAARPLTKWPYKRGAPVDLYVLAGHRNMEGERAFVQELRDVDPKLGEQLLRGVEGVAFRYDIGSGAKVSDGWEPMGAAGLFDTFGPELSFAHALRAAKAQPFAVRSKSSPSWMVPGFRRPKR